MENKVQVFNNKELELQVRTLPNPDGSISISAEDTAIGLGWCRTEKRNGKEYTSIRWERMNGFSEECGFAHKWAKDDYIPESLFYRLGMKASNPAAEKFQNWLALDVIPSIRKTGSYEMPKKKPAHKEKLPSVNQMVKNIKGALNDAGVDSKYIAAEIIRIYSDNGYPVKVPLISEVPVLWDCTTMAKEFGILSESGRPHDKAVSAIIQKLDISEEETVKAPYTRNGHPGVTIQYKDSVFQKVKEWLEENGYPTLIEHRLSNGNTNKCKVVYQEVA